MYHGYSMNKIASILQIPATNSGEIMKEMLKRRYLNPIFGENPPILPILPDTLLIENKPDIFITGHTHNNSSIMYNNILLINSGCWQSQTKYQLQQGHIPTPGIVEIINLKNLKTKEKVFINENSHL